MAARVALLVVATTALAACSGGGSAQPSADYSDDSASFAAGDALVGAQILAIGQVNTDQGPGALPELCEDLLSHELNPVAEQFDNIDDEPLADAAQDILDALRRGYEACVDGNIAPGLTREISSLGDLRRAAPKVTVLPTRAAGLPDTSDVRSTCMSARSDSGSLARSAAT